MDFLTRVILVETELIPQGLIYGRHAVGTHVEKPNSFFSSHVPLPTPITVHINFSGPYGIEVQSNCIPEFGQKRER